MSRRKRLSEIRDEWDRAAPKRAAQIDGKQDLSFHRILLPSIDRLAAHCNWEAVLDAGCGTGFLAQRLAERASEVLAVDVSKKSIVIARTTHAAPNLRYEATSIERLAARVPPRFTLVVANMTLMTVPNLRSFVGGVARLLRPGGHLIFTITHPWFWPLYWRYAEEEWFDYTRELAIEAPLQISLEKQGPITTHYHRPIEMYVAEFSRAKLLVDVLEEPFPEPRDAASYPEAWSFPRFLAGRCLLHGRAA